MKIHKFKFVVMLAFGGLLIACSKQESPEEAETKRQLINSSVSLARTLSELNPKHDTQYYLDKIAAAITACNNSQDFDACLKNKIELLKY